MKTVEELIAIEDELNHKFAPLLEQREADIIVEREYYLSFKNWLEIFFGDREDLEIVLDYNMQYV